MILVEKIDVNLDGLRDYDAIIQVIDDTILQLLPYLADKMLDSDVVQYSLNTGQSQVTTQLKSNQDFTNVIRNLEKLRELYVGLSNRRDGNSVIQLQDSQNFTGWGC